MPAGKMVLAVAGKQQSGLPKKVTKIARSLAKVKKQLKEDTEIKSFDGRLLALTQIGYGFASVYNLFAPTQGLAGASNPSGSRVGDRVRLKGIDMRYNITNTSTTLLGLMRVIVFVDYDNLLGMTDVFETASTINTVQAPMSFYNRLNRDRFRILYDKLWTLDTVDAAQKVVKKQVKVDLPVVFQAGAATIQSNAIKIAFISNQLAGTSTLYANYACRLYYADS